MKIKKGNMMTSKQVKEILDECLPPDWGNDDIEHVWYHVQKHNEEIEAQEGRPCVRVVHANCKEYLCYNGSEVDNEWMTLLDEDALGALMLYHPVDFKFICYDCNEEVIPTPITMEDMTDN